MMVIQYRTLDYDTYNGYATIYETKTALEKM